MKILYINKFYSPDIGGIETVVKQYAEHLAYTSEVTVLCCSKGFTLKTKIEYINNVKVIRSSSFGTYHSMPISLSFFIRFFFIKNFFNIIHFHEPFPLASILYLFHKKSKYIITWHSDIIKHKVLTVISEYFQKKLCKKSDIILTTSQNLSDNSNILKLFKSKVKILPLSINTYSLYNLEEISNRQEIITNNLKSKDNGLQLTDGKQQEIDKGRVSKKQPTTINLKLTNYILFIGRLAHYKGINVLLKAFYNSNSNLELLIVGDGNESIINEIQIYAEKDKRITFINKFISEEDKYFLIKNCSFFVFPSIYPSEAFGIMQLEAMYFCKPVINTNLTTGVPWVSLDKKTGLTVDPGNIEQLKNAIETLSNNRELCHELGKNAKKRVELMFSDEIVLPKLAEVYKKLINH